jgi:ABC-type multidrug transport system ATPase subunit/ABC-type multidrug transport system permease subunit
MQTDVALPNLTVRETLIYAAQLRLSESTPRDELEARVDGLIEELGLIHCANTRVGSEMVRGVSGGELRRLSIAQELINDPDYLFLDEPTSGLDSSAAYNLARLLRRLARNRNQAIISSIHQPSPQTFALFDKVLLLSKSRDNVGRVAYFGPTEGLAAYLESVDLAPRPGYAVADHIIELANANAKVALDGAAGNGGGGDDDDDDGEFRGRTLTMTAMPSEAMAHKDIVEVWERSDAASDAEEALRAATPAGADVEQKPTTSRTKQLLERHRRRGSGGGGDDDEPQFKTSFANQVSVFTRRSFIDLVRGPDFVFARLLKMHIIGFICVTLWLQLDYSATGIQNRVSVLFFSLLTMFLLAQGYIPVVLQMRAFTARERNSKLYGAFAQMCGLLISQLPLDFCNAIALATYLYWGVGLRSEFVAYIQYITVFGIVELLMVGLILLVSAVSMTGEQATILASLSFMPLVLTLGFFVLDLPSYYAWLRYVNPLRYALGALLWNEFHGLIFDCAPGQQCTFVTGDQLLKFYDVDISGTGEFWLYEVIIGAFVVAVYIALYFAIRFAKFEKR